ncbi:MAG: hypothetical protein ACLQB1_19260 [Streptosporangiaceae bacterium]
MPAATGAGVGADVAEGSPAAPTPLKTTSWTEKASVAGSTTRLPPAASVTVEHAANCSRRPVSRSAKLPDTRVGTTLPFSSISGPRPHGSWKVPAGGWTNGTPGMVTSVICSGAWIGENVNLSPVVRIGAKLTRPSAPTIAPRNCPPDPVISTWSRAEAPAGRWIVSLLIVRW